MTIHKWLDISSEYSDGLILGNGASIAFDDKFSYQSLYGAARTKKLITEPLGKIFNYLKTTDFELVMRVLWHANTVNAALKIKDTQTSEAYDDIRNALIQTVRSIHCSYESVAGRLKGAADFMAGFKTVTSLNYDLLVYWSSLAGNKPKEVRFKDCFINGEFRSDWEILRKPIDASSATTLLFFPHGNLVLGADIVGTEKKIKTDNGKQLLETVFGQWNRGELTPLFISEGVSAKKLRAIRTSPYLSTVYDEVLPSLETVAVYGWSFSDSDDHLLETICSGKARRFAVSTLNGRPETDEYCARVRRKIKKWGHPKVAVEFFDAQSKGCWIYSSP